MALESIGDQVQWLVDRAQISDLLHRFASCLDAKDYQGYAVRLNILWLTGTSRQMQTD